MGAAGGTVADSSVLLDVFKEDPPREARGAVLRDFLIGAHAVVTGRPLLTRDPRSVASHIPGARLIAPGWGTGLGVGVRYR